MTDTLLYSLYLSGQISLQFSDRPIHVAKLDDVVGDLLAALSLGHLDVGVGLLRFAVLPAGLAAVPVDGVEDELHSAEEAPAPVGDLHRNQTRTPGS